MKCVSTYMYMDVVVTAMVSDQSARLCSLEMQDHSHCIVECIESKHKRTNFIFRLNFVKAKPNLSAGALTDSQDS